MNELKIIEFNKIEFKMIDFIWSSLKFSSLI